MNRVFKLPAPPALVYELMELAGSSALSIESLSRLLESDAAVSASILRTANSAFFAPKREQTDLAGAMRVIGLDTSVAAALCAMLANSAGEAGRRRSHFRAVWYEAVLRAFLARAIAQSVRPRCSGQAFLLGLFLELGVLALLANVRGYECFLQGADGDRKILMDLEMDALGVNNEMVAKAVCSDWQLPRLLVDALFFEAGEGDAPVADRASDDGVFLAQLAHVLRRGPVLQDPKREHIDPFLTEYVACAFGMGQDDLDDALQVASFEYSAIAPVLERTVPRGTDAAADLKRMREAILHAKHSQEWLQGAEVMLVADDAEQVALLEQMLRRLGVRSLRHYQGRQRALREGAAHNVDLVIAASRVDNEQMVAVLPSLLRYQSEDWARGVDTCARLGTDSLWFAIHNLRRRSHPSGTWTPLAV